MSGPLAEMRELRREAITAIVSAFKRLEQEVPPPQIVQIDGQDALRYVEKAPHQAMIQKLARYVSGLQAMEWLNFRGWVQEQAVIQRTLDDLGEDVAYIVLGLQVGMNKTHRQFLDRFWQEEFEEGVSPIDSTATRYNVSRTAIRNWLIKQHGVANDGPEAKSRKLIQQVYSGYVHGASPHIMEMCGGDPPRFCVSGLKGTSRQADHEDDLWNYSFRGLLTITQAAVSFGDEELVKTLNEFRDDYERRSGTNYRDCGFHEGPETF